MKHDWIYLQAYKKARICNTCGKRQVHNIISYDRLGENVYGWRPLAGGCGMRANEKILSKIKSLLDEVNKDDAFKRNCDIKPEFVERTNQLIEDVNEIILYL